MSTLQGGVMRKLLLVVVMGILASFAYGEEAGILPEGELRVSESHNIGNKLVSWSFGAEFATSDWFNIQAMWTSGLKLHSDVGFGAVYYIEEERRKNSFTFDFVAGFRFFFNNEFIVSPMRGFYIEPFIRTGYPFLFSGGLMIGHWFNF